MELERVRQATIKLQVVNHQVTDAVKQLQTLNKL
jgi:hypothetical protein